ncbi:hypothetical protein [Pseudomonas sp. StFLB209]|uniref:hypothetical protein n=1 Tax=Pseudomonas sp. StFLB209 TaxID=1028989 RepID=UPI0011867FD8|nr:hypothetical protein [Pseudomonas sp. StFLB209]
MAIRNDVIDWRSGCQTNQVINNNPISNSHDHSTVGYYYRNDYQQTVSPDISSITRYQTIQLTSSNEWLETQGIIHNRL